MLGGGGMDSEVMAIPVAMVLIGLALLVWACWESGELKKPR